MNFRGKKSRRRGASVDVTPLIDVMFNLLVFLLVTTVFADDRHQTLDLDLPTATSGSEPDKERTVEIAITREGALTLDGAPLTDDELRQRLRDAHTKDPKAVVVIHADSSSEHGKVVDVLDAARLAGFSALAIATASKP